MFPTYRQSLANAVRVLCARPASATVADLTREIAAHPDCPLSIRCTARLQDGYFTSSITVQRAGVFQRGWTATAEDVALAAWMLDAQGRDPRLSRHANTLRAAVTEAEACVSRVVAMTRNTAGLSLATSGTIH